MFVRLLKTSFTKLPIFVNLSHARSIEQIGNELICNYPPASIFEICFGIESYKLYICDTVEDAKKVVDDYYALNK